MIDFDDDRENYSEQPLEQHLRLRCRQESGYGKNELPKSSLPCFIGIFQTLDSVPPRPMLRPNPQRRFSNSARDLGLLGDWVSDEPVQARLPW